MGLNQEIKSILLIIFALTFFQSAFAQTESEGSADVKVESASDPKPKDIYNEKDYTLITENPDKTIPVLTESKQNKRRIRRHLNLISGLKHDEEILIPEVPLTFKGNVELIDLQRIKGTDMFRILPKPAEAANGIVTIHNKKTGQIYAELRLDIRPQAMEKTLRELKALLADVEGLEYKIVSNRILVDGYVMLPKDLLRISTVIGQLNEGGANIFSLANLSPLARKKIIEYIARDINNPEVTVTSVGDSIKLEGVVNSQEEKTRISKIVELYMPEIVTEKFDGAALKNVEVRGRRLDGKTLESLVVNLITVRPAPEETVPPPKMIQVVVHFVEFSDRYLKDFNFMFSPSLRGVGQAANQPRAPTNTGELADIVDNLLPKLNWARTHGFLRVLDTASVLTQNSKPASIVRTFNVSNGQTNAGGGQGGGQAAGSGSSSNLTLKVTPAIKSERSGLIELILNVNTTPSGGLSINTTTAIDTTITVRDGKSAAFGGIINKKSSNDFGGPSNTQNAIVSLNHGKKYERTEGNFVVFVTPKIKSSASAGVEQVKKKFRMKE